MFAWKCCSLLLFLSFAILPIKSLFNVYPKINQIESSERTDPGEPLFLTPLIEAGNITQAQDLSAVHLNSRSLKFIKSYSGYLTVNKEYNSNLFFWFFPALKDPENAPVILWLQGGPGASSLFGLFAESGPIIVTKHKYRLKFRRDTWNVHHSLLYIDNPVGTGFSFADSDDGYARNETQVGSDLYEALLQFFQLFPNLQKNPFIVAGESYGGKYVPAISYTIHKNNENAIQQINLQGIVIGNGLSDPENQLVYGDYLYQLGIIDDNTREIFHEAEANCRDLIQKEDWEGAFEAFDAIVNGDTTINGTTLLTNYTDFHFYFNFLHSENYIAEPWGEYVQLESTRKIIHVGNQSFHDADGTNKVENFLKLDMMQSVVPWIIELLDHYRMLFYNGQLDIIVAYPYTVNFLQNMNFSSADEYKNATRNPWYVSNNKGNDKVLAGYVKTAGNLTEVLVRNAGHMVPVDQPKFALDLISKFVANEPLCDDC